MTAPQVSLKPCPFCGGAAQVNDADERTQFYVACQTFDCYCCVGEAYDRDAMPAHVFRSAEDAAAAWNLRSAPATEAGEIVAALRETGTSGESYSEDAYYAVQPELMERVFAALSTQADAWQPIATAPRTSIIVCGGTFTHESGDYPEWPLESPTQVFPGQRGNWVTQAEDGEYVFSPTHWQPLPPPPIAPERE